MPNKLSQDIQRKLGQATLTEAAKLSLADQRTIYQAYFSLTIPHLYISYEKFKTFMASTLGWPSEALPNLFRSFNIRAKNNATKKVFSKFITLPLLHPFHASLVNEISNCSIRNHPGFPFLMKISHWFNPTSFFHFLNSYVELQLVNRKLLMVMPRAKQGVDISFDIMTR